MAWPEEMFQDKSEPSKIKCEYAQSTKDFLKLFLSDMFKKKFTFRYPHLLNVLTLCDSSKEKSKNKNDMKSLSKK